MMLTAKERRFRPWAFAVVAAVSVSACGASPGEQPQVQAGVPAASAPIESGIASDPSEGSLPASVRELTEEEVTLPALPISIPTPEASGLTSLSEVEMLGSRDPKPGSVGGLRFREPGPIEGTFVSSATVSYIVGEQNEAGVVELAEQTNPTDPYTVERLSDTDVAYWPEIGRIDGRDIGQGTRVFSLYMFKHGGQAVQVHFDGVDEDATRKYVESIIGRINAQ